jgi:hypothetical protein
MRAYDPDGSPDPADWLACDGGERAELVAAYHQRQHISLPNPDLHAVIHVVVENQLALGEAVVVATAGRLVAEGLTRHDAIHAIGSVLAEHLYELMRESAGPGDVTYATYLEQLTKLNAQAWRRAAR